MNVLTNMHTTINSSNCNTTLEEERGWGYDPAGVGGQGNSLTKVPIVWRYWKLCKFLIFASSWKEEETEDCGSGKYLHSQSTIEFKDKIK